MRDGGINGAAYVRNSTGAAGYNTLINSALTALNSVTGQAADSASWLDGQYQAATNSATYQTTLSSQALSNATGVNIDQQMSQMLDLENSYQASAKLISTIDSMFNSLLQAVA
jgi:flagellar hook-associated protein 1 FlgK